MSSGSTADARRARWELGGFVPCVPLMRGRRGCGGERKRIGTEVRRYSATERARGKGLMETAA